LHSEADCTPEIRVLVAFCYPSKQFYVPSIYTRIWQDNADPSGRAVQNVGLRPLACCSCGFESRRRHGCLSLASIMCCQVEVSAPGWSLVQTSPTECDVSKWVRSRGPVRGGHDPESGRSAQGEKMTRKQQQEHGLELVKIVSVLAGTNANNLRCCGDYRRERGTCNYVQVRITLFSY